MARRRQQRLATRDAPHHYVQKTTYDTAKAEGYGMHLPQNRRQVAGSHCSYLIHRFFLAPTILVFQTALSEYSATCLFHNFNYNTYFVVFVCNVLS